MKDWCNAEYWWVFLDWTEDRTKHRLEMNTRKTWGSNVMHIADVHCTRHSTSSTATIMIKMGLQSTSIQVMMVMMVVVVMMVMMVMMVVVNWWWCWWRIQRWPTEEAIVSFTLEGWAFSKEANNRDTNQFKWAMKMIMKASPNTHQQTSFTNSIRFELKEGVGHVQRKKIP